MTMKNDNFWSGVDKRPSFCYTKIVMETINFKTDYKTELEKNGILAFVPGGNSMWPTLKNRGQSVVVLVKKEKLKRYDVALYLRDNGTFVLHRVIEPTEWGYIICGDSQFTAVFLCRT